MSVSDSNSEIVMELAEEFLDRYRAGERPTIAEYTTRHPALADEIREVFPAMAMMENIAIDEQSMPSRHETAVATPELRQLGDFRIIREAGRGGMGVVYEAEQVSLGRHVALKVLPSSLLPDSKHVRRFEREAKSAAKLHHTNIVPVFGVGDQDGMHYYVMQFIQGLPLDEVITELKKFQAQPTGQMTSAVSRTDDNRSSPEQSVADVARSLMTGHFAQTQIGESDSSDAGEPTLIGAPGQGATATADTSTSRLSETMNLSGSFSGSVSLPGKSGVHAASQHKNLTYWESVANIGYQVADAMQYAHEQGILHRDIKPSNLLLDMKGTTWITDFGLAKATDQQDITHTGDILGMLRYMPPEAFEGNTDARSDVYSLGLTLYELLSFQPAYNEKDRHQLVRRVTTEPAPRLDKLNPSVPRDLVTIIHKAIDHDPSHRYQTAEELAEDLQRFLCDEPIKARRISLTERFTRWSRRNKGLAAALTAVALLLFLINIAGTLVTWKMARLNDNLERSIDDLTSAQTELKSERDRADGLRSIAEQERAVALQLREQSQQQEELTRRNYYFALIHMANAAVSAGDQETKSERLDSWETNDEGPDLRSFEWYYLNSQHEQEHRVLRGHSKPIRSVAWHPDGHRVASGSRDNTIRVWDARTGTLMQVFEAHLGGVWGLDWSPDGTRLASASTDSTVKIWDAESEFELLTLRGHTHYVFDVKWSPDGTRLATASWDQTVRIWDADSGRSLAVLPHDEKMWCVDWHPDGLRLATGGFDSGTIRVWDSQKEELLESCTGHTTRVASIDWHRDGQRFVSGGSDGDLCVWELGQSAPIRWLVGHDTTSWINKVAWSPVEDNWLLACGDKSSVRLWNVETGTSMETLVGHSDTVASGVWSPDGRQIATGSHDTTLRIWSVDPDDGPTGEHERNTSALAWSPDGSRYATGSQGNTIRIWQGSDQSLIRVLEDQEELQEGIRDLAFSPDGRMLASGGKDGFVRVWSVESGQRQHCFFGHGVNHGDQNYRGVNAVAWHPGGTLLVSSGEDSKICVWDIPTGELKESWDSQVGSTYALSFSPDGSHLAAGHFRNQPISLWETTGWKRVGSLDAGDIMVRSVEFSPDGSRLAASGGRDRKQGNPLSRAIGLIRVWDWKTAQQQDRQPPVIEIDRHSGPISEICWSPDGKRLASTSVDGTARLWDVSVTGAVSVGRELLRFPSLNSWDSSIKFSPDGSRLVLTEKKGVAVFDAFAGYAQERSPQLLRTLAVRVAAGTASAEDYRMQARIDSAQGNWGPAARSYTAVSNLTGSTRWMVAGVWVTGYFSSDLKESCPPENIDLRHGFQPDAILPGTETATWQRVDFDPRTPLNFSDLFGQQDNVSAYAVFQVFSPVDQRVGILIGDDDAHRLWVNGQLVSEETVASQLIVDEYVVPATLTTGWNSLLVRVVNVDDQHGLQLRISDDPVELADAFERTEQFESASRTWDEAIEAHPDDRRLLLRRAMTRFRQGNQDGAAADFTAYLAGREDNVQALEARARVYLELGLAQEGRSDYQQAVAHAPESLNLRDRFMRETMRWNLPRDAARLLDELRALDPDEHLYYFWRAPLFLINGDEAGYQAFREEFLSRWQDSSDPQLAERTTVSCLLRPANEDQLAVCARLAALAAADDSPRLHWYFMVADGMARYRQGVFAKTNGDTDQAQQHFAAAKSSLEDAIAGLPDRAKFKKCQARFILAATLHYLGEDVAASESLQTADRQYREFPDRDLLGILDKYVARILRSEATALILGSVSEKLQQAEELITQGETEAARQAWGDVLDELAGTDVADRGLPFYETRGGVYLWLNELPDAAEDFEQIVRLDPEESFHYLKAASLLVAAGKTGSYRQLCQEALNRFAMSGKASPLERIVKISSIMPQDDPLVRERIEAARAELGLNPGYVWAKMTTVLAEYRSGNYRTAIERGHDCLVISREKEAQSGAFLNMSAFSYLVQAMSHHRLGNDQQARSALEQGQQICSAGLPKYPKTGWWDTFISQALLREAEALINGSKP